MPCPSCGSMRIRPSRPRNSRETFLRAWTQTRYYHCKECGWRDRRPRPDRTKDKLPDVKFWTVAALLGIAVLYLLYRNT